jgi:hypothetical protein
VRRSFFLLDSQTTFSYQSKRSLDLANGFAAPPGLMKVLQGAFWLSGMGGVAVAAVFSLTMAIRSEVARSQPPAERVQQSWRYIQPGTSGRSFSHNYQSPSNMVLQYTTPSESPPVIPPFDISFFADPEYVRNIEQLYNPWLGQEAAPSSTE